MVASVGGFVPRRMSAWSKDPVWAFAMFGIGYWMGEYVWVHKKVQVTPVDPHRYIYNPLTEH